MCIRDSGGAGGADEDGLALACRVVGGWPNDYAFDPSVELAIPFEAAADIVKILYKAEDGEEWAELPADEFTQPHRFEARVTSASLGYWAILKVPDDATDDAGDVAADISKLRRDVLKQHYGFECRCDRCKLEQRASLKSALKESQQRRR